MGVAPRAFTGLFNGGLVQTAAWIPLNAARSLAGPGSVNFDPASRDHRWMLVYGRLGPRGDPQQAAAQVAVLGRQFDAALAAETGSRPRMTTAWGVRPIRRLMGVPDQVLHPLVAALIIAVTLVGLVACTNLANLMLARHARRRAEMSVRVALGATRWRLVREASGEAIILAAAGGLLGLAVARALMGVFSTELSIGNATLQVLPHVNSAALVAAIVATALSLIIMGLIPAIQSTRGDLQSGLSSETGAALPRWRGRRLLITFQVASSVLLVSIAMLYVGEIRKQRQANTGIDLDHLALMHVDFGRQGHDDARARQIAMAVIGRMAARPDVDAAALSAGFPLGINGFVASVLRSSTSQAFVRAQVVAGTSEIFRTLGVPVIGGRALNDRDRRGTQPVAVLTEWAATRLFGIGPAIGREVVYTPARFAGEPERPDQTLTVVGIAGDTDAGSAGRRDAGVMLPAAQSTGWGQRGPERSGQGSSRAARRRTPPGARVNRPHSRRR